VRPTFSPTLRHYHDSNVARLIRVAQKKRDRAQRFDDECRNAPNRGVALKILVREALKQYKAGFDATAQIPFYFRDCRVNAYRIGRGPFFRRERNALGERLHPELESLLHTFIDCEFTLEIDVGYFKGTKQGGDEGAATIVTLHLLPNN
jgi:hypothetical protein